MFWWLEFDLLVGHPVSYDIQVDLNKLENSWKFIYFSVSVEKNVIYVLYSFITLIVTSIKLYYENLKIPFIRKCDYIRLIKGGFI